MPGRRFGHDVVEVGKVFVHRGPGHARLVGDGGDGELLVGVPIEHPLNGVENTGSLLIPES